jgi:hypothetical protein
MEIHFMPMMNRRAGVEASGGRPFILKEIIAQLQAETV